MRRNRREHFGSCYVQIGSGGGPYPCMEGAIEALDPFQGTARAMLAFTVRHQWRSEALIECT